MMTDPASQPLSVLEIDLDEIARNWMILKKKLKRGTACGAVVKADAYGLGADSVSLTLYDRGCRDFFVATFEEGATLRHALAMEDANIIVLHGLHGAAPKDFAALKLTPVLNNMHDITRWASCAWDTGQRHPAILHVDTGMNRLGISPKELAAMDKEFLKQINLRCVMSHLACADDPAHPKNRAQLDAFKQVAASLPVKAQLSLANSGGILLGPDYHFDLVRPGCWLYGIDPVPGGKNPVHTVITLKARILQIREITPGETVGYGAAYKALTPVKCATISVGYADGYLRSMMERGTVTVNGHACPVIGRVSMDLAVIDITAVTPPPEPGDWVEIIGASQTVNKVAAQAGTIGYEILTSLGQRYKWVYMGL